MKPATPQAVNLMLQGAIALAAVEAAGIRIDVPYLTQTIADTERKIAALQEQLQATEFYRDWQKHFRDKTKLGSRQQLASMLFDEMKVPYPHDFSRSGRYRADEEVLRAVDHPFVRNYLKLEEIKRIKGTFLEGIRSELVDGFIHPSFNLHTVQTYRSSSQDPNFQNLPVRDPEQGEIIRRCFIARKGRVLIEMDYAGIEVRVAACYHRDPTMLAYIKDPTKDMHRDMAAQIYCLEPDEVSKQARYCAKNQYVFPEFYGAYYKDCARSLWDSLDAMKLTVEGTKISLKKHLRQRGIRSLGACRVGENAQTGTFEEHVRQIEQDFWGRRFHVYDAWKKTWYEEYLKNGSFRMLTGFVVEGVYRRNEVLNYAVQGAAFHCLLWSLISIHKELRKRRMRTKLIGQIHDSILADVPVAEQDDYLALAREVMTQRLPQAWSWLITPLEVEAEAAPVHGSWHDKKKVS